MMDVTRPKSEKPIRQIPRLALPNPASPVPVEKFWTGARVEQLLAMDAEHQPASQIGRVLGVSRNTVIGKLNRLKAQGLRTDRPKPVPKVAARPPTKPKIAPPEPAPAPTVAPVVAPTTGVTIFDLGAPEKIMDRRCRFIAGAILGPHDTRYCGERTASEGASYCAEHATLCYVRRAA